MADATAVPPSAQMPKAAKRSFFKKPAWATAEETKKETPQTGPDSFRHSNRVFLEIVEEQKKKEEEKARQKEERRKKRKSDDSEEWHGKRRRASEEREGSESPVRVGGRTDSSRTPQLTSPSRKATRSNTDPSSLSARYEDALKSSTPRKDICNSHIIDLSDDSESDDSSIKQVSPRATTPIVLGDDSDVDSNPEYRPITLQMRKRDPQKEVPANVSNGTTPTARSPPKPDPVVKILISSPIPGTNPLVASRKLSQRLQEVRTVWCAKQQFPPGITPNMVFLTYRNRRLWDVATCRSIGLEVDAHGMLKQRNEPDDFEDDMEGRVHLVAVTQEILADIKRRAELGLDETGPAEEEVEREEEEEEEVVAQQLQFRLYLRAKGMDEFKLGVKPDTTFEEIAGAFRRHKNIPANQQIFLMFDGDRLEPQDAIKDSDVQDKDAIEVHIK